MTRFSYCQVLTFITVMFLLPLNVAAQTGVSSVTVRASVSETVALSISPVSTGGDVRMDVASSGSTARLTLSGTGAGSSVVRVPLIVRSNSGFKVSAIAESRAALLTQLSVTDVRATGTLVSPEAVNNLQIQKQFDQRGLEESLSAENVFDVSHPFLLLSGPRVSLGGTLNSPNNALQITLLIRVKSESVGGWLTHLTFSND